MRKEMSNGDLFHAGRELVAAFTMPLFTPEKSVTISVAIETINTNTHPHGNSHIEFIGGLHFSILWNMLHNIADLLRKG